LFNYLQVDELNSPLYEQLPKKSPLKELKSPIGVFWFVTGKNQADLFLQLFGFCR